MQTKFWYLQFKKEVDKSEKVQKRAVSRIKGLHNMPYRHRLKELKQPGLWFYISSGRLLLLAAQLSLHRLWVPGSMGIQSKECPLVSQLPVEPVA